MPSTMTGFKFGICVLVMVIGIKDVIQGVTLPPELILSDDTETLRRRGLDYDVYQYEEFPGLPIQDVFKTVLLRHELPKKYSLADQSVIDYEDSDLLLDSGIYERPYDPYFGGILEHSSLIRPRIKSSMKTPVYKKMIYNRPWLEGFRATILQPPIRKKEYTISEVKPFLNSILLRGAIPKAHYTRQLPEYEYEE